MSDPVVNALAEAKKAGKYPARKFNKREDKIVESVLESTVKMVPVTWSFAANGGAVSDIPLGVTLPAGAVITACWIDVNSALVGSGTLTLTTSAGASVSSAVTSSTTGVSASTGLPKKVSNSADVTLRASITSAVLTGGSVTFHVQYV